MPKEEIGHILKALRKAARIKRQDVADALGVSVKTIGHWETGYAQPDANTLFILCDMYGTTVDAAFGIVKKDREYSARSAHLTAKLLADADLMDGLEKYFKMTDEKKQYVLQTINLLSGDL